LADDVALFDGLVITHDSIAENVHFLSHDPADSVGWKLVAVNLSDLACKGATPAAALLSMTLRGDSQWEASFLDGIAAACRCYGVALIGGDTIALPAQASRLLGLTAIGRPGPRTPARSGGRAGDRLWLVGKLGESAAGLAPLRADSDAVGARVDAYRRPVPLVAAGQALAPHANAMMDISDGLLLDVSRLADASDCRPTIDLASLRLSAEFVAARGDDLGARLFAATGGDDYALLAALPAELDPATLCLPSGSIITCIGSLAAGRGPLQLLSGGSFVALPEKLGHEHCGDVASPMADRS
jgi:thiamine-monophosphate kinase